LVEAGEHWSFTTARAIALRSDFTGTELRALARQSKNASQARRLLALAVIYDGGARSEAAKLGDVTLQIVRDWVLRFNAEGPRGLIDRKPPDPRHPRRGAVAALRSGPMAVGGVPAFCFQADPEPRTARHGYAQALDPAETPCSGAPSHRDIQKNFSTALAGIAADQGIGLDAIEIWFADEARIGQKNKIIRRWARRGTRPSAPQDQRTASTYIFGAVCPRDGKGAALVLPFCNTAGMSLHLAEIARTVEPGRHAVLLLDQAGWHLSVDLEVPANITFLPLPAKCLELNVMENVWQFMRDNWLFNRVFRASPPPEACGGWAAWRCPAAPPRPAATAARPRISAVILWIIGWSASSAGAPAACAAMTRW